MRLDEVTEELLQAAGLEKQSRTFGFGNPIYKDAHNTYFTDAHTGKAWFTYRNDKTDSSAERYAR